MPHLSTTFSILLVALPGPPSGEDDWPRFRGPNGSGVSDSRKLPAELDPKKNLLWKQGIPGGNSSPVVLGGRLFLTGEEGDQRVVLCLDAASGEQLWRRSLPRVRAEVGNEQNGGATPTPAGDAGALHVFFPEIGLIAMSHDGDERWRVPLGPFRSMHGIASSPVLVEGKVVLLIDQLEGSYLAAFEAASGKQAWRVERASGVTGGYSTPAVHGTGPEAQVIVAGALELAAYAASSGQRVWWATGLTNAPVAAPVVDGDRLYISEPVGERHDFSMVAHIDKNADGKISREEVGPDPGMLRLLERIDRNWGNGDEVLEAAELERAFGTFVGNGGLVALRLGGAGDVTRSHVAWRYTRALPYVPSALVYRGVLYMVRDGGIVTTLDPRDGAVHLQGRLEGAMGSYYASPVAGDGKVFLVSRSGKVSVLKAQPRWELLSTCDLAEECQTTPAIAAGRIYIRTRRTIHCFAGGP